MRRREAMFATNSAVMPRLVRTCALGRGIQYAAAYRINHACLGVLDRPVKPGDDSCASGITAPTASDRNRTALRSTDRPARSAMRSHPTFG
ncbi:hypothetical protein BSZ22_03420 [Bradyrhizobium canariense]|uniref:Uncharacterized protein n=1 Tax=Bradyrhizobium canariense TaxID=255045 RepID=A0A1X3GBH5_9BRAD|nr:hypothetical protein BSZ21_03155 [Bradyrhizobium canariense]OSI77917.1 hypothetical protein BSZ22_03420 [Bradyrhizobium canariense]OSI82126.1 hypothetical protein BSZ23_03095 [Bradyrhizobium canariense]OSI84782.1 hypothetical protein BSZ24_32030 [Bradyrhizobium canariense]OSI87905.1 hypothetical protein BSZ25_24190 [Bradyrhizobium canariense]